MRPQLAVAQRAEILMRALAQVGVVALVDEATGYQEVRDRLALQAILDQYLRKELAAWAKRFPDNFYREIFRLRGWKWDSLRRPGIVAGYTKNIVYARIAPGILEELERKNPRTEKGYRKAKHHQWLTEEVGHPALERHLEGVMLLLRISDTWQDFRVALERGYPRLDGNQLNLPFN
ncbi:P63C domain-containing protein [Cupriavidus nantongensis]|nr:P63C domain-containing protein [Cupriavidus nantongensis]